MGNNHGWTDEKIAEIEESLLSRKKRWVAVAEGCLGHAVRDAMSELSNKTEISVQKEVDAQETVVTSMAVRITCIYTITPG